MVLRTPGPRKSLTKSLVHLEPHVAGSAFWGAANLGRLWNPKRNQQTRRNSPIVTIEDANLDMEVDDLLELPIGDSSALSHKEHLTRKLVTMEHFPVNLTEIRVELSVVNTTGIHPQSHINFITFYDNLKD